MSASITAEAIYDNGVLRLFEPLPLRPQQRVTVTVQVETGEGLWPADTVEIYRAIAEEDQRLAAAMAGHVQETWPRTEESA